MNRTPDLPRLDRRSFVLKLPVLGATVSMLASSGCASFPYAVATEVEDRVVIQEADFGAGDFVFVETRRANRPLYVHRGEEGRFTAVLAECTHRQCQPEPVGDRLVCPCHGSQFSHGGDVLEGPAERPLPRFDVDRDHGKLTIWWSGRPG